MNPPVNQNGIAGGFLFKPGEAGLNATGYEEGL